MGELTAKKDRALSGWDIRYLVPFWPEPDSKKWPDIRYIPNLFIYLLIVSIVVNEAVHSRFIAAIHRRQNEMKQDVSAIAKTARVTLWSVIVVDFYIISYPNHNLGMT